MTTAVRDPQATEGTEEEAAFIRRVIDAANERDLEPVAPGAIVVGDDGSPDAGRSLTTALEMAERLGAPVVVVQTWTIESSLGELSDHHGYMRSFGEVTQSLRTRLEAHRRATAEAHPSVAVEFRVVLAQPAEALVELSRDALMLVLGSRGLGSVGSLMLGSVGMKCLHRAQCPVLVVPHARPASVAL
jgi:nucleotide-binding universal stress UspA family protein